MNKYQEALSSIFFTMHYRVKPKALGKCEDSNFETLQKLVDKATPKKPTKKIIDVYMGEIPSEQEFHYYCKCGEWVGDEYVRQEYCPSCGQAIDWSEEE